MDDGRVDGDELPLARTQNARQLGPAPARFVLNRKSSQKKKAGCKIASRLFNSCSRFG
jgi:hypothetical protein